MLVNAVDIRRLMQDFHGNQLPKDIMEGLLQDVMLEDYEAVMAMILSEQNNAKQCRKKPWYRARFLSDVKNPADNPFWILFGYQKNLMRWSGSSDCYSIAELDGAATEQRRAQELLAVMQGINSSSWRQSNQDKWECFSRFVANLANDAQHSCAS